MVKITNIYLKPPPNNKNHGKVDPRGACTMYLRMFIIFSLSLSLCAQKKIYRERQLRKNKKSGKLSDVSLSCLPIANHLLSLPYSLRYPMMWNSLTRAMADHMGALPFPFAEHRLPMFWIRVFGCLGLGLRVCLINNTKQKKTSTMTYLVSGCLLPQKKCKTMNFPPFSLKKKTKTQTWQFCW